jgi:N,N'-diacetyllegionaminate synthase
MTTLIIAEAGVNHNGDMQKARALVAIAARAGADLVKFQTFSANALVASNAPKASYQVAATGDDESQHGMIAKLELRVEDHHMLVDECRRHGIGFFSTGFDHASIDLLLEFAPPCIKLPSGEITNLPMLRHVAAKGLPVIMSTGMAGMGDIEAAIAVLEGGGITRDIITVLHCNTEYPTPMHDVNLKAMVAIGQAFGVRYGYSDHTLGIEVATAAVALGACVIEKHFTLDRTLPGPDHAASLEPDELSAMVRAIRNVEAAMAGDGIKRPSPSEYKNRAIARRSIVASRPIATGEMFSEGNLTVKRPGTGVSPMRWDELIGRVADRGYAIDEQIHL